MIEGVFEPLLQGQIQALPPETGDTLLALADEAAGRGMHELAETARSLASFQANLPVAELLPGDRNQIGLLVGNLQRLLNTVSRVPMQTGNLVEPIAPSAPNPNDRVALYMESRAVSSMLLEVLKQHGFSPFLISSMDRLADRGREKPPAAIVADLSLCRSDPDTRNVMQSLREQVVPPPHLFCIGSADDISARLEAVRLGATRFLPRPLDVSRLLAVLRGVTERAPTEPLRVLLVDDDSLQTMMHGAELAEVGLEVLTLNDPLEAPAVMDSFRPDVIVIDIYMPGCNGLELAALLRQDDGLVDTPILFLSAESSIPRQMVALDLGGDDFLTKPVPAEILQAAVIARAKRARMLRRTREEYARMSGRVESLLAPGKTGALTPLWRFDPMQRQLLAPNGIAVRLTAAETALVRQLFTHPGGHASREELIAVLQGLPGTYDSRRLEALISRLRRKTREKCGVKLPLQSEYGRGYSFAGHVLTL